MFDACNLKLTGSWNCCFLHNFGWFNVFMRRDTENLRKFRLSHLSNGWSPV